MFCKLLKKRIYEFFVKFNNTTSLSVAHMNGKQQRSQFSIFPRYFLSNKLTVFEATVSKISRFFSSRPYCVLVIVQTLDFPFLADLLVLGSGESKKHKISIMSDSSLDR